MDDQLLPHADRWTVRLERILSHPVERVWRAVTEPDELSVWFPARVEVDLQPGGTVRFGMDGPPEPGGTVLALDPPHLLAFTWGDDELRFELAPHGDGTRLVLMHTFADKPGAASFCAGWQQCLAALPAALTGAPPPAPSRAVAEHEALAKRFGLDEPSITDSDSGWIVRFERQLVCDAATAWDLFLGRDQRTGLQRTAPAVGEPLTPFAAPDVVLGTVTEVDPPQRLVFATAAGEPGDEVELTLRPGTGHGARMILTVTGTSPDERKAAVEQWGAGAVEHIAAEAAALALSAT